MDRVRTNIIKSDWLGRIVSTDMTATMVVLTLQDRDPETGRRLDLRSIGAQLDQIRQKFDNDKYRSTSSASPRPRPTSPRGRPASRCVSLPPSPLQRTCATSTRGR